MDLRYRSFVDIDALALNECTVHSANDGTRRWWQLWLRVARDSDGIADTFVVPIAPGSGYAESGPSGRKTWGFFHVEGAVGSGNLTWAITPSIDVPDTREPHPGPHPTLPSLWHRTPRVVGVPDGERWMAGEP